MNQFLNPVFVSRLIKTYLFDIDRLHHLDERGLAAFQDKRLRKMVDFAYTVPLYHDRYKQAGVHPEDIRGTGDIQRLPIIDKHDIMEYYPEGITSSRVNKDDLIHVSTSGTTGKSLSIYVDMYDIAAGLFGYIRQIREWGVKWHRHRMAVIADFAPNTVESGYINKGLGSSLDIKRVFSNIMWLDTNEAPENILKKLNEFKPEFIGGYYGMLGHLALLKREGHAPELDPQWIATTGTTLDGGMKRFLEATFGASVFESYGSTESGALGYTCPHGRYHMFGDYVFPEFLKDGVPVGNREPGRLVITKLYGSGTPIIRYDAINDVVDPIYDECCPCGVAGQLIHKVYGRDDLGLVLDGGLAALPSFFSEIFSKVITKLHTRTIYISQIVEHDPRHIEIRLMQDKDLLIPESDPPGIDEVIAFLKGEFESRLGEEIKTSISVVERIVDTKGSSRIVSEIDRKDIQITRYL